MESITTGITNLMTIVEYVITAIVGNTYLLIVFSAGFIGLAASVIGKISGAAKAVD